MTILLLRNARIGLALACLGLVSTDVRAQDETHFPNRNLQIIVGNAAGGGIDFLARLVGQKLAERLGKPVVIENKPGANSTLAANFVAKAPPDGHTLLAGSIGVLTVNPAVLPNLSYDTQRDFVPISIIASFPLLLVVNSNSPIRNVQDLIAYAKANPDKANAGASGPIFQVVQKMFELRTGTRFQYVAYRANSEAMIALMRGDLLMSLSDSGPVAGPLQSGRVRALAVTSPKRMEPYLDVPTMAEAGIKDMEVEFWAGLVAPAKTPASIVKKLQDEIIQIVKLPDVVEKMKGHQVYPVGNTSEEYADLIAKELKQWAEVVKVGNIKIE